VAGVDMVFDAFFSWRRLTVCISTIRGTAVMLFHQHSRFHDFVSLQRPAVRLTRSRCMQLASELRLIHAFRL
jgi:hypothetical protein